jgi:hypothetical protein
MANAPQTKPINSRFTGVMKEVGKFFKKTDQVNKQQSKTQRTDLKSQLDGQKQVAKQAKDVAKAYSQQNAALKEVEKTMKSIAALQTQVNRGAGGGGSGGSGVGSGSPSGRGGAGGGGQGGGRTSMARRALGALGIRTAGGLGLGVLGAGLGFLAHSTIGYGSAGIDSYASQVKSNRDLSGIMSKADINSLTTKMSEKHGFSPDEALQMIGGVSSAVGVRNVGGVPEGALEKIAQMRRHGISDQATIGLMGSMRQGGVQGFDTNQKGLRLLERVFTDSVASGLEKTRTPEFMENLSKGIQGVGSNVAGEVNVAGISDFLKTIGKMDPAFQGARGGQVAEAFQNRLTSVARGQAAPDVTADTLMALGYGAPGSDVSYYQAMKEAEQGISGPGAMKLVRQAMSAEGGDFQNSSLHLARSTGLSISQSEKLISGMSKGAEAFNAALSTVKKEEDPIDKQLLEEARTQSRLDKQSYDTGEKMYLESQAIKQAMADIATRLMPGMAASLEVIVKLLSVTKDVIDFVADLPGEVSAGFNAQVDNTKKALAATDSFFSGTGTFGQNPTSQQERMLKARAAVDQIRGDTTARIKNEAPPALAEALEATTRTLKKIHGQATNTQVKGDAPASSAVSLSSGNL